MEHVQNLLIEVMREALALDSDNVLDLTVDIIIVALGFDVIHGTKTAIADHVLNTCVPDSVKERVKVEVLHRLAILALD